MFLWGVAGSGFQSEGSAPDSNWKRYARNYGDSVDFFHRCAEDIALAADLGVRVFRFCVEWARVQPKPGSWDFSFYDEVIARVRAAGMRPMITLDHWVYPAWAGNWGSPEMLQRWLDNAAQVIRRYAGDGTLWITFNEPTVYMAQEMRLGSFRPQMPFRLVRAHKHAYRLIHAADPDALVSSNVAYIPVVNRLADLGFLDWVSDSLDFVGIDYYYDVRPGNLTALHGASGELWRIDPEPQGIYRALRHYARRFPKLPLYIVENGMPSDDGAPRADGYTRSDHLRDHVYWMLRARSEGVRLIGYNYWSLTDNYEWGSYRPRFGLYTVDVETDPALARKPTDAVGAYRAIVAADGLPESYRPVR
ncbi:family 1 glycosylhydrolase [Actinocrispum sp. NPDC049592]|uniref:family 1 glycosylhydrolase n=1 Tax=Actinocrispum sp. NPDC049592 TaxID=3154835 RepID=UPI00341E80B7